MSDNVRFLFSPRVDTTCEESVEEKQKERRGVASEEGVQKLVQFCQRTPRMGSIQAAVSYGGSITMWRRAVSTKWEALGQAGAKSQAGPEASSGGVRGGAVGGWKGCKHGPKGSKSDPGSKEEIFCSCC